MHTYKGLCIILQATWALALDQESSQTVPQAPLYWTSILPSLLFGPFASRTFIVGTVSERY